MFPWLFLEKPLCAKLDNQLQLGASECNLVTVETDIKPLHRLPLDRLVSVSWPVVNVISLVFLFSRLLV